MEVHVFNHRSVAEILRMVRVLGGMVGCEAKAEALRCGWSGARADARSGGALPRRPRVYFEEWDEPQISGIRWVSELIGIAGGEDCFPDCARVARQESHHRGSARSGAARAGHHPRLVVRQEVPARDGRGAAGLGAGAGGAQRQLHEIKSSIILQPGPAALTDGVRAIHEVLLKWQARRRPTIVK